MRRNLLTISLATFSILLGAANSGDCQTPRDKPVVHPIQIRIQDGGWGGGPTENIQKVCHSAAMELWKHFPDRRLSPIVVSRSRSGPIVLYERLADGQYQIRLDSQDTYWAQFSFQFAHEFCHILCGYRERPHPNKWFEESLCELASLYSMRQMSETWKTAPPYPNWKSFAPHLKDYADKRIAKGRLPENTTLAKWYEENAKELRGSPTLREKNEIVAVALLPLFEKEPSHWEAVGYLNAGKTFKNQTFEDFLTQWRYFAPQRHKAFIQQIAAAFDIRLE